MPCLGKSFSEESALIGGRSPRGDAILCLSVLEYDLSTFIHRKMHMHSKALDFFSSLLKDLPVSVTCGYPPSSSSPTELSTFFFFVCMCVYNVIMNIDCI